MKESLVDENNRNDWKQLVIARFKTADPNTKIMLLGEGEMTIKDVIKAVTDDTKLGKKIVEVHSAYIKMLTSGEIDI